MDNDNDKSSDRLLSCVASLGRNEHTLQWGCHLIYFVCLPVNESVYMLH